MALFDVVETLPRGADYVAILPEIVLSIFGMLIMVLDPVMDEKRSQRSLGTLALIGAVLGLAATDAHAGGFSEPGTHRAAQALTQWGAMRRGTTTCGTSPPR